MFKLKSFAGGSLKNYILLALGELILVVLGILIALQVNNWNLDSMKKEQETKILTEINEAFISDTVTLDFFAKRMEFNTRTVNSLVDALSNDQPYHDSLDKYFAMVVTPFMWSESSSAYKTLLSKGIDIVSNDEIRNDIVSIHSGLYNNLDYLDDGVYLKYAYIHEYCIKHFNQVESEAIDEKGNYTAGNMKPNDYEALKKDPEYLAILRTVISQQKVFLKIIEYTQQQIRDTIDKISKELESRK